MIRCLTLTLALSAAVMMPSSHPTTHSKHVVRSTNSSHLNSLMHTTAHSGYIIASS